MAAQNRDAEGDVETQRLLMHGPAEAQLWMEADRILWVAAWTLCSCAVILHNKWVFSTGGFPYPMALTSMHMMACFLVFGAIRKFAPEQLRLTIMPDADVVTSWPVYVKQFLSVSFVYAFTLGTGQMAYMVATVPFIQMLRPMNCIFASLFAFIIGTEIPTHSHMIIVSVVAFGICFATHNAAHFSKAGCLLQILSSATDGIRLNLVQSVTTTGMKLDPVSAVYHFSFASSVLLACACFALEWPLDLSKLVSPWILVMNCSMAVVLNVLAAIVIKKTSAVVFTLSAVFKDLGIIGASSILFMTPVTRLTMVGYSISLVGLCMYKVYKDNFELFREVGFLYAMDLVLRPGGKMRLTKDVARSAMQ